MCAVHASQGPARSRRRRTCSPRSTSSARWRWPRSGTATTIPWADFRDDYTEIRRRIARVVPGCAGYDEKVDQPGGFVLPHPPRDTRTFPTDTDKAIFTVSPTEVLHVPEGRLLLQTMRSHDQFNTTIYGLDDRYRGIKTAAGSSSCTPTTSPRSGLEDGQLVDIVSEWEDGSERHRAALPGRLLRHPARLRRRLLPRDERRWCRSTPRRRAATSRPSSRWWSGSSRPATTGAGAGRPDATSATATRGSRRRGEACSAARPAELRRLGTHGRLVMSNLEDRPTRSPAPRPAGGRGRGDAPREVPLGGPRAMRVRRTLPQRERSLIGAWCFVDHYGPDDVADSGGMSVAPHPHTGLQTVSWLFTGEIEHRDSAGHHAMVRPGEVNLMTAGRGISHSEVSTPATTTACTAPSCGSRCPTRTRDTAPGFAHHAPDAGPGDGLEARVFLGSLLGVDLAGADGDPAARRRAAARAGRRLVLDVDPAFEHGVLVDTGGLVGRRPRGTPARPRLRPARACRARAGGARRARAGAAARRPAVRRVDRDVVELRGPHPRGDRRATARSGRRSTEGASSRTPRTCRRAGSGSPPATTCRRSRRPRCPTRGSSSGVDRTRLPAPPIPRQPSVDHRGIRGGDQLVDRARRAPARRARNDPSATSRTPRSVITRAPRRAGQRQVAAASSLALAACGYVVHQHDDPSARRDQVHRAAHALDHRAGDHPVREVAVAETCMPPSTATSMCPPRIIAKLVAESKYDAPGQHGDGLLAGIDQIGVDLVVVREGPDAEDAVLGVQGHRGRRLAGGWGSASAGRCRG